MHWWEKYIGRPYELGRSDCASLVVEVLETEFGADLPSAVKIERSNVRSVRNDHLVSLTLEHTEPTTQPVDGDIVLMRCNNRPSHVGVYLNVHNEPHVLHAMENAKMVVLHRLRDIEKYLLKIEGFYKWNKQH